MSIRTLALCTLAASSLLVGCDRTPVNGAATSVPRDTAMISPVQNAPLPAVAQSPRDPSVPSAAAALDAPKTNAGATPDTEVTKAERDKAMPLPGQANDHSSPEFAKKGDDTAPKPGT